MSSDVVGQPATARTRGSRAPLDGPLSHQSLDRVIETVDVLRGLVAALPLPLALPGVVPARRERDSLLRQMDDYLLPRLMRRDAPLLTVIGGSTGAGKSTLTNSLLRREVSRSGLLRPTTRSPVLIHHPGDSGVFLSRRILPNLERVTQEGPEPMSVVDVAAPQITSLRLVPHREMPQGMALLDAPDIDSLVGTNRQLAFQLLEAADLWVFVTTAARYADAVPWRLLDQAGERGVAVAVVLDRVPPDSLVDLRAHLARRLAAAGLGDAPIFVVPETTVTNGYLPPEVVRPLWTWLTRIATDQGARELVVQRTLQAVIGSLRDRVSLLATAVDEQAAAADALRDQLDLCFLEAEEGVASRLTDGTVLRGDVLARWPEFLGSRATINPAPMMSAVHDSVVAAVTAQAQEAAFDVVARWRSHPAGAQLLEGEAHALVEPSSEFLRQLSLAVTAWQAYVIHTVRRRKPSRRTAAAVENLGAEAAAIVLTFAAFEKRTTPVVEDRDAFFPEGYDAQRALSRKTAALEQARGEGRRAVREASSATPIKHMDDASLEDVAYELQAAIFGSTGIETLAAGIRDDLLARVEGVLEVERSRFVSVLARADTRPGRGDALRSAVAAVTSPRGGR